MVRHRLDSRCAWRRKPALAVLQRAHAVEFAQDDQHPPFTTIAAERRFKP